MLDALDPQRTGRDRRGGVAGVYNVDRHGVVLDPATRRCDGKRHLALQPLKPQLIRDAPGTAGGQMLTCHDSSSDFVSQEVSAS